MEQDFAKFRTRTPLAEPETKPQPSSAGLLFTGLLTGIVIGLFASLLVWISGMMPPSPGQQSVAVANTQSPPATPDVVSSSADEPEQLTIELEREAARLQLEFYQELPNYEVVVDVTPVNVPQPRVTTSQQPALITTREPAPDVTQPPPASASAGSATRSQSSQEPGSGQVADEAAVVPARQGNFLLQAGAFQQQNTANAQANRLLSLGLNARVRQEFLSGRTLFLVQAGPYATRDEMMQAERLLRSNNIETMRITLSQP